MNERIKELWEEATVSTWPRPGKFTAGEYDYHLEKFAELIVRGCIDIVKQGWINPDEDLIAEEIKQYFGVEE
jgi:hypothetical protein